MSLFIKNKLGEFSRWAVGSVDVQRQTFKFTLNSATENKSVLFKSAVVSFQTGRRTLRLKSYFLKPATWNAENHLIYQPESPVFPCKC